MSVFGGRTPFIAGNWKMNKTIEEAETYIQGLLPLVSTAEGVDIAICPSFLSLQAMVDSTRGSLVQVYAQNAHWADSGAYTGDVSPSQLAEVDVAGTLVGHSERRQYFGETDKALAQKVPALLAAELDVILCVGETEDERERGDTERKLRHQLQEGLEKVPKDRLGELTIAYEPIWAIGTGLTATAQQAQDACAFCRALVESIGGAEQANRVRVLYGGSMKGNNAEELLSQTDVDGGLIGGASLDPKAFNEIIEIAAKLAK